MLQHLKRKCRPTTVLLVIGFAISLTSVPVSYTHLDVYKRQQRQVDYPLELIPAEETIEQKLLYKEAALQIHKQLHSLDQPYKEVFWMRTFGELSFKEIGILFGKTESWARVTYHRAKVRIKEGVK